MSRGARFELGLGTVGLVASSTAYMVAGVVRQKLAVNVYGADLLAVIGQANLLATLTSTVITAGLLLSARIVVSDGTTPLTERLAAGSWLVRRPLYVSIIVLPILLLLAPEISQLFTSTSVWADAFQFAIVGVAVSLPLSAGLVLSQILDSQKRFLATALASGAGLLLANTALMLSGDLQMALATFTVSPFVALLVVTAMSPGFRSVLRTPPSLSRHASKQAWSIGASSTTVGVAGVGLQAVLSAFLAHKSSLEEVALLQPVLLAAQGMAILTSAVTNIISVHRNKTTASESEIRQRGPWRDGIVVAGLVSLPVLIGVLGAPLWIAIAFNRELSAAAPAIGLQASADVLAIVAWVGGSMMLPAGKARLWMTINLLALFAKALCAGFLIGPYGYIAIPLAAIMQQGFSIILCLLLLRPRLSGPVKLGFACTLGFSASIALVWLRFPDWFPIAGIVSTALGGVGLLLSRRLLSTRELEAHPADMSLTGDRCAPSNPQVEGRL